MNAVEITVTVPESEIEVLMLAVAEAWERHHGKGRTITSSAKPKKEQRPWNKDRKAAIANASAFYDGLVANARTVIDQMMCNHPYPMSALELARTIGFENEPMVYGVLSSISKHAGWQGRVSPLSMKKHLVSIDPEFVHVMREMRAKSLIESALTIDNIKPVGVVQLLP